MSRSNKSRIYGCCISRGTCSCLVSWCAVMLRNVGCKSTCFGDEIQRGGFHKRRRISWLAESMLTSQEQVHSKVLVWYLQCFWNCSSIQTESNKNWRQKVSQIAQNSCRRSALKRKFLKTEVHFSLPILIAKINWGSVTTLDMLCRRKSVTIPFRNVKSTEEVSAETANRLITRDLSRGLGN